MNDSLSPSDWQLLEQYADGALSPAERQHLEARLAAEPALRTGLQHHAALVAGIRQAGRQQLRQRLERVRAEEAAQRPAAPMHVTVRRWPRVAAAATVLLAAGLTTLLLLRGSGDRYTAIDHYGVPDPGLPVMMSDGATTRPLLTQAMNAYKLGDYAAALQTWNRLPSDQIGPDTLHYYRGIFLLRLRRPTEAAAELAQVRGQRQSRLRERADYYHALALWADGRVVGARDAFEQLARRQAHPFAAAARQALPHVK